MGTYALPARKQPGDRTLRCLNCFKRLEIPPAAKIFTCPKCGVEYEIGRRAGQAKILGTVHYFDD